MERLQRRVDNEQSIVLMQGPIGRRMPSAPRENAWCTFGTGYIWRLLSTSQRTRNVLLLSHP